MRRILIPAIFGVVGCAMLLALGFWQVDRLGQKHRLIDEVAQNILADPLPLPPIVTPEMKYLPTSVVGTTTGEQVYVVSGMKGQGGGYLVLAAFETDDGRRILVDRGFVPQQDFGKPLPPVRLRVRGNLHFPNEIDGWTPEPDPSKNLWFARDVPSIAKHLNTEPVLVVAAAVAGPDQGIKPIPVSTDGIPNNHLQYAVTWFLLAATWALMTIGLVWRITRAKY